MVLLKELNKTDITYIPKKENPMKVNDFRSISLYSVSYKFISKLLTNRLRKYIPKIISPLHSAFAPDRDVHDNILVTHEIFSNFHRKREKV